MEFNNELEDQDNLVTEIEEENSLSIDDFLKELEAKEKDLQISSDMSIEFDESEIDDTNPPEFIKQELGIEPVKKTELKPILNEFSLNNKVFAELENEISQIRQQVSRLEAERTELSETMRRRQTDFDNYKKRIERDRSETFLNQISNLATQMLPVLDNMNRALDFAAIHSEGRSHDFHQFFEGIILVNQQLNEVLAEMGVSPIASVGEHFDPHIHEAVAMEESGQYPPNTVTGELLRGYRIGDKIIRAAMVKVATAMRRKMQNPSPETDVNPANAQSSSPANTVNPTDDILETE
jgi:molecular chaperone GrpE